ncbi:MAG: DUF1425 domain-containing protein [Planctomycetes bacterium]|nr:DUF1425 domain-containing protein [Planctomycetota bacterium]
MSRLLLPVLGLALLAAGACDNRPHAAPSGTAPTQQHQVVFADTRLSEDVYVGLADADYTAEGRMRVRCTLQNNSGDQLIIGVRAVFKDAQGFSTGDETPWKRISLSGGANETYSAIAMNDAARKFHIEVRKFEDHQ